MQVLALDSGLVFQTAVLAGSFSVAFLILLVAWLIKRSVTSIAVPPPLPVATEESSIVPENGMLVGEYVISQNPWRARLETHWVRQIDVIGLLGLCMIFGLFCFGNLAASDSAEQQQASAAGAVANIAVFGFLLMITVMLVIWRIKPQEWLGLRWRQWYLVLLCPVVVFAMWIMLALLNVLGYVAWMEEMSGSSSTQQAVKILRENKDLVAVAVMAFTAVIVAPIVEEVIFRGYIYPVAKRWVGIIPAVLFSSLVFAAGHGNATLMLPLFVLGGILALAYEFTGSIWMPMAIHACFNGATVLMQLLMRFDVIEIPKNLQ